MVWDMQYEITALILIGLFFVFYNLQKSLPIRKNIIFSDLLLMQFLCIITDIIAAVFSSYPKTFGYWHQELSNMSYFLCVFSLYYLFMQYCRYLTGDRLKVLVGRQWWISVPFWFAEVICVTNPLTGFLYRVDETGFTRGSIFYELHPAIVVFYSGVSLAFIFHSRKRIPIKEKVSLVFFVIVSTTAAMLQIFVFRYLLLINIGCSFSLAVCFLSMQNPEFDRDQKTRVFNRDAMFKYLGEKLIFGKHRYRYVGITFQNYGRLRAIYGSGIMDKFLNRFGIFLKKHVNNVMPFYLQSGEFLLVLNSRADKDQIMEQVKEFMDKGFCFNGQKVKPKAKFIYMSEECDVKDGHEVYDIIKFSLKKIEKDESNDICDIDDRMLAELHYSIKVKDALHKAVDDDAIIVYYQPIYDSIIGAFSSAEALVRIEDPELGVIPPAAFISLAEEDGTILRLGNQVLRKVCRFISEHDMDAMGLKYIEINLSPIQCMNRGLAKEIIDVAKEFNVDMSYLNFEITETAKLDIKDLNLLMDALIGEGSGFSLDDYGTGFSNLVNVLKLPFDIVKIDKSVVWSYFDGNDIVLPRLISMFAEDDFGIVAEGAETDHMQQTLQEMGCDYIQGFYFSKPIPEFNFIEFIKEKNISRKKVVFE
ncbi:MAG: EAL domain-containing protein [Lachnospiraceae bacterium]|nr:EAL domain-containing protein [Lachnospiraceae bacterium]